MRNLVLAAMAVVMVAGQGVAQDGDITGSFLLAYCTDDEPYMQGFCSGFITGHAAGFRDGLAYPMIIEGEENAQTLNKKVGAISGTCPPDDATIGLTEDAVVNYLKSNPEMQQVSARAIILLALREAFPCTLD